MHFREIVLHSQDLDAQWRFYHELLGFPLISATGSAVSFQVGQTRLTFVDGEKAPDTVYHFAFNIPENQLDAALVWLSARTPIAPNPNDPSNPIFHFEDWNAHAFYFYDGNNNIGEFIARHNLPNASDAPFSAKSILEVSEIGLPTPHVQQTVAELQARFQLPIWRGAESDVFTAVGDEYGLLITVVEKRLWLASQYPATPLFTEVDLDLGGDAQPLTGLPVWIR